MFVALHTAALVDPTLARTETREVPDALHRAVHGPDSPMPGCGSTPTWTSKPAILVSIVPSLAQARARHTPSHQSEPSRSIDYALDRALGT